MSEVIEAFARPTNASEARMLVRHRRLHPEVHQSSPGHIGRRVPRAGQDDSKHGATLLAVLGQNPPVMSLDDGMDDCKPEAQTRFLGGEERLEEMKPDAL